MIAVVPVRDGEVAGGGAEAIGEAGGTGLLVGSATLEAARSLGFADVRELRCLEVEGGFRPGAWAQLVRPHVSDDDVIVLPASPDGRDLAGRLAAAMGRPLLAGAVRIGRGSASLARHQGHQLAHVTCEVPFVATLLPGSRGAATSRGKDAAAIVELEASPEPSPVADAERLGVLEADPASVDLAEAERIVAAGAGLGGPAEVALLAEVASNLGASFGATRVVTDGGWLGHERQIGTTGISVHPRCYVAFGVSGAAQHIGGLGTPEHVIAVNTDRSCPMMAMADLGLVTDAAALVKVLAQRLAASGPEALPSEDLRDPAAGAAR